MSSLSSGEVDDPLASSLHDDNRILRSPAINKSDSDQRLGSDHERWWEEQGAQAVVRWDTATPTSTGRHRRSVTHGWTAALIGAAKELNKVDENQLHCIACLLKGPDEHLSTGADAWVRVNEPDSDHCDGDLCSMVASRGLQGIVLSRTESAEQVQAIKARLRADVMIVALLQTAAGIENAAAIASAHGTRRLVFGSAGLGHELCIPGGAAALLYAGLRLVMASLAANLPGRIDGPSADLGDMVGLAEDLRHSISVGFTGKLCVHPHQLRMTNSALTPRSSKLAWARRVLAATHASAGSAVRVDGEMVDWQQIEVAQYIVSRAALFDLTDVGHRGPVVGPLRIPPHRGTAGP